MTTDWGDIDNDENNKTQVKICGVVHARDLNMLDRMGVDYAGLWFNMPQGKYNLKKHEFVELARTPLNKLQCIGVTTESNLEEIAEFARESAVSGIQLHGFQLPREVLAVKRRLGESIDVLKVLHIRNGECLENALLKEYGRCGADAFILDNYISRECSGSTGKRIPAETVSRLAEVFGTHRLFLAGGQNEQGIREMHANMPLRGVDIDTGARHNSRIDYQLVRNIVSAARSANRLFPIPSTRSFPEIPFKSAYGRKRQ